MRRDDDDFIRTPRSDRRRQQRRNGNLVVFAAVAGFGLLAVGVAAVAIRKPGGGLGALRDAVAGPSERAEGDRWNQADMLAHFRAKGVARVMYEGGYYFRTNEKGEYYPGVAGDLWKSGGEGMVEVEKFATPRAAYDWAGERPGQGFSWGRFAFRSRRNEASQAFLIELRAALP